MSRVAINKELIRWAVDRSGQDEAALVERFPKLPQWESGEVQPTFKQLEDFAKATLTPFGAFFLPSPPQEKMPVPDFRTMRDQRPRRPSAALLETIYQMQRRQEWMREYLLEEGADPLPFIGTVTLASSPLAAAETRYMDDKEFGEAAFAVLSKAIYDSIPKEDTAAKPG